MTSIHSINASMTGGRQSKHAEGNFNYLHEFLKKQQNTYKDNLGKQNKHMSTTTS